MNFWYLKTQGQHAKNGYHTINDEEATDNTGLMHGFTIYFLLYDINNSLFF